jgi:lipopolysaccharide/colanic/teichoic acid biosynthesis glycosyltransferase
MHMATGLDIEYVDSVSLRQDLKVLLSTVPAALGAQKGN